MLCALQKVRCEALRTPGDEIVTAAPVLDHMLSEGDAMRTLSRCNRELAYHKYSAITDAMQQLCLERRRIERHLGRELSRDYTSPWCLPMGNIQRLESAPCQPIDHKS